MPPPPIRHRVLLVDDSEIVRAVVAHKLTEEGLDVTTIADPHELADAVVKSEPHLLLVDTTFPGIELATLAELVKPHAASCPVIVFSDRPSSEIAALIPRLGAKGTIPKQSTGLRAQLEPFLPK